MSNDSPARELRVSTWKTVMLVVVAVLFVVSCVCALILRANPDLVAAPSPRVTLPRVVAAVAPQPPRTAGTEGACYEGLSAGGVTFQTIPRSEAPGVAWPIKLTSAVDGVLIHGGKADASTNYLDCRLALALLAWAPSLREQGVVGLEHYSAYRRDAVVAGTTNPSGHAIGSAIDVGLFEMRDGRKLSVLEHWKNRARGTEPCQVWSTDDEAARIMRKLVCDAYQNEVFQTVITPHYNDAHKNHVHLEVAPRSEGAWIG